MILDTLDQCSTYEAISPRLVKAFNFLRQMTDQFPVGRHEIDGDDVYAMVQSFATTAVETRKYEAHRKYIDVQYLISGREVIYWAPLPLLTEVLMPFDEKQDAALYGLVPEGVPVPMRPGQFMILFPEDGHIPGCIHDSVCDLYKVVVKVRV
jgi:biofilm protein TabA